MAVDGWGRLLCTTALEETWGRGEPLLFLGEWCRRYSRRHRWAGIDAEVLPYHWDDRAKLYADYRYLQDFHERLLQDLSRQLNERHGVDHSLRYWRILVGPWLGYFVPMLFDRWTSIQHAISQFRVSGSVILDGEGRFVPNDMSEFARFYRGDEWNHYISANILERYTGVACVKRAWPDDPTLKPSQKTNIKRTVAKLCSRAAAVFSRDEDVVFLSTYLPRREELRLCRRLGQMPQLWRSDPPVIVQSVADSRQWVVSGESRSQFEDCARTLIPRNMPTIYLEGYVRLMDQIQRLHWPRRPKLIWTSNAAIADDVFKAWAAEKVQEGSSFVIGQHGGHYGLGLWSFDEDHEIAISDRYLSWGWTEQKQPHVKPVGQLIMKRPLGVCHAAKPTALLVLTSHPRQSYHMYSVPVSRQWLDYFEDQFTFVKELPPNLRDALVVRLSPFDSGWDLAERWQDRFPQVRVDSGKSDMDALIRSSRLYISTYNATSFLESFTMDVPSVIYWNPTHWELRSSGVPYFEDLKRAGIFHETPESAACHVAAIWNDVDAWWSSPIVRKVVDGFKSRYCRLPDNLLDCIDVSLREVMAATPRRARRAK